MKKIFTLILMSFFIFISNSFAIEGQCEPKGSALNIYYKNILERESPEYIGKIDNVLQKFYKKNNNKTVESQIKIYKNIQNKINSILENFQNKKYKNVIGYLGEQIGYKIYDLDVKLCDSIATSKDKVNFVKFISNLRQEKVGDILKITGDLIFGVDKVVITFENKSGEFSKDIYKLHNFEHGDRKFKYNASYRLKNLDNGTNFYNIKAYIGEKSYSINTSFKENSIVKKEKNTLKTGKYCVLDTCLDISKGEIISQDDKYIQKSTDSYIKKDKSKIVKKEEEGLSSEETTIQKIYDFYVKSLSFGGCGSNSIKQEFFDKNAKKLLNNHIKGSIKKKYDLEDSIKFGNFTYNLKIDFKENVSIYDNSIKELGKINSSSEIKELINKKISEKIILKKYIFYIEEFGVKIYLMYETNFVQPERLIFLGNDKKWLKDNISSSGDFYDLETSNKILSYFGESNERGMVDKNGKRIFEITKSDLPIFNVKKFNNSGKYMLYTTNGYKITIFAEMCKPAVYIYNSKETENNLFLKTNYGNYFTKLIPEFTENNSWTFSSKNGKIEVSGKKYDYLYYAIKVKNYKHNLDGWIVLGENIEEFFNEKLDKINFNSKEKKDFLEYWLPKYDKDKYYFVSFKYKKDLDKLISLEFSEKPNKIFRVLLDSYQLEKLSNNHKNFLYSKVKNKFDKFLIKKFDRNNSDYEVFEWGGVLEKNGEYFIY